MTVYLITALSQFHKLPRECVSGRIFKIEMSGEDLDKSTVPPFSLLTVHIEKYNVTHLTAQAEDESSKK